METKPDPDLEKIIKYEFPNQTPNYIYIEHKPNIICLCQYCEGNLMRKDIKHFKIFAETEYYLEINTTAKEFQLSVRDEVE